MNSSKKSIKRCKSASSIATARFRDPVKEMVLSEEEQERRANIASELAKIDLSGKNLND